MPCDYKKYPPNWKTEIRPAILARANNACEICGVENYRLIHRHGVGLDDWVYFPEGMEGEAWLVDGLKIVKVILTVAHLDHDLSHNEYSNLKAMCQKCHLRYDVSGHANSRKYGSSHRENNYEIEFDNF